MAKSTALGLFRPIAWPAQSSCSSYDLMFGVVRNKPSSWHSDAGTVELGELGRFPPSQAKTMSARHAAAQPSLFETSVVRPSSPSVDAIFLAHFLVARRWAARRARSSTKSTVPLSSSSRQIAAGVHTPSKPWHWGVQESRHPRPPRQAVRLHWCPPTPVAPAMSRLPSSIPTAFARRRTVPKDGVRA